MGEGVWGNGGGGGGGGEGPYERYVVGMEHSPEYGIDPLR